jgi:tetratricopeptide (TPR) repeat protein
MKQIILSTIAIALLCSALQSCLQSKASTANQALQMRADTIGKSEEWKMIMDLHTKYVNSLIQDKNDDKTKIKLVELYLNEARITGNANHYNALAMTNLNQILENNNGTSDILYQAYSYKATVLLSLHQFAAAKKYALQALQINAYEADIYGALIDANIELGNYDEAVMYCDKMLSVRPDLRSYSRASYIREIYGDNQGAIQAMTMAVEAGATGMENTEWARVHLGDLYLNKGALDTAKLMYDRALAYRPNYVHAQIGLAKIAEQNKQLDTAITITKKVIGILPESSFVSYFAKLTMAKNDIVKAKEINNDVVKLLEKSEAENKNEKLIPHNGNREMAQAYLQNNQLDKALQFAKNDLALRPNNIDANELMANIYYQQKDLTNAVLAADKALMTNKKNMQSLPLFINIYTAAGNIIKAAELQKKLQILIPNQLAISTKS